MKQDRSGGVSGGEKGARSQNVVHTTESAVGYVNVIPRTCVVCQFHSMYSDVEKTCLP